MSSNHGSCSHCVAEAERLLETAKNIEDAAGRFANAKNEPEKKFFHAHCGRYLTESELK